MKKIILILGVSLVVYSCDTRTYEDITPVNSAPTYTKDVKPIMEANCTSCHSTSGGQYPDLSNYQDVKDNCANIILRMKDTANPMPPNGVLPASTVQTIQTWQDNGNPEN
jgi:cytochrome c5